MNIPRFVVMTSSVRLSGRGSPAGRYRNVAVVETDTIDLPLAISDRAQHCVRIVRHWGACNQGKTARCQYAVAKAEADALAAQLNADAVIR